MSLYVVHHTAAGDEPLHRGQPFLVAARPSVCSCWNINGVDVIVVQLKDSGLWWIVAAQVHNDERFTDIGPFNTMDDAAVYATLMDNT